MRYLTYYLYSLCLCVSVVNPGFAIEPWATYRGNPGRTGNTDAVAGPKIPKILWKLATKDHFVASPVIHENRLFVSGLGAFNVPLFYCLNADPKGKPGSLWVRTTPYLRIPTVSSPGIYKGKVVFGDGMHDANGSVLHCLDAEKGLPLWQLAIPGELVHLEGSPTITEGRVYIGAGSAGVFCVSLEKITFEGKDSDIAAAQKIIAQRWKDLLAKYEVEKQKDKFALPPTEDDLPRAQPKTLWQQGKAKWHVDAPVNVVGDNVLVASAFLDKEQMGERALVCLDAKTGDIRWKTPLKLNPWGGASVQGDTVVVTGSSIGYDTRVLKGAKGFVAAFDLKDGKERWNKEVTGGVVSCAALGKDAAVVTATDGKVRAFELASGERRWIYDARMPFFAAPALSGPVAYAGDLKGVLHAIDLKTGQALWTLDIGSHPEVQAPGMIYGGPALQGGRIYLATCNLEGPNARAATVVVCIGEK